MLRNVTNVDLKTTILGEKVSFPLGIAPTALQKMAHPDGEIATAKGINLKNRKIHSIIELIKFTN